MFDLKRKNKMKKFENVYQDAALMKKALLGEANESEQQELEKRLAECPDSVSYTHLTLPTNREV